MVLPAVPETRARRILPVLVFSQFACTSLWFAGNAVIGEIASPLQLPPAALGYLVSAVQLGFIAGTFLFAVLGLSDRFSPVKVFFLCALLAAFFNLGIFLAPGFYTLLFTRFGTGFFLAGIYPVGMKIASDYQRQGLGLALGFLVGALVLGTAFPHLLHFLVPAGSWPAVIWGTTVFALLGGLLVFLFVPDGPYRQAGQPLKWPGIRSIFKNKNLLAAAGGYWGHMWELYAFWAFVPVLLNTYFSRHHLTGEKVPLWAFCIIAMGGAACVAGGYWSRKVGSHRVAAWSLVASGACCLLVPLAFYLPPGLFLLFLFFWGWTVVMDSPQFSALVARTAPEENKGTALTLVNCLGFLITIGSVQLLNSLLARYQHPAVFMVLVLGPAMGLLALLQSRTNERESF